MILRFAFVVLGVTLGAADAADARSILRSSNGLEEFLLLARGQQFEQAPGAILRALRDHLDPAVVEVRRRAPKPQLPELTGSPPPEPDALHVPAHPGGQPHLTRPGHAVVMPSHEIQASLSILGRHRCPAYQCARRGRGWQCGQV